MEEKKLDNSSVSEGSDFGAGVSDEEASTKKGEKKKNI